MSQAAPVIAIDGPSGSGKGTISRLVADRLGWRFLDSGALYRLVALAAERHGIAESNEPGLATLATYLDAAFSSSPDGDTRISLEGEDVSDAIRRESCGNAASKVAALPGVRDALLARQRAFRESPGLVADGRDMGTVVFPDAEVKIFLTASAEERAKRRHKQLNEKGVGGSLTGLIADIAARDARDSERAVSPLKPAPDAHVLDTTALDIGAVVERVMAIVDERLDTRSE